SSVMEKCSSIDLPGATSSAANQGSAAPCTVLVSSSWRTSRRADLSGLAIALLPGEYVNRQQQCTNADGRIGNIESSEAPAPIVETDEVNYVAKHHPVVEIAQCATEDQGQGDAQQALPGRQTPEPQRNNDAHQQRYKSQSPALPAACVAKKAERGPTVVYQQKVEKTRHHRLRLRVRQQGIGQILGQLV